MFQNAPFDEKSVATVEELDTQTKLSQNIRHVQTSVYKQQRHSVCNHATQRIKIRTEQRNMHFCYAIICTMDQPMF